MMDVILDFRNALRFILTIVVFTSGCTTKTDENPRELTSGAKTKLFQSLPAQETGIDFINSVPLEVEVDQEHYKYQSNGAGVGAGDLNNDGLVDLVFASNLESCRIYLNKGNLQFEDITEQSGLATTLGGWCGGVCLADVNADGWLDIYLSRSGNRPATDRTNLCFLNNKDETFTERGERLGIADDGNTTQSAFFDQDLDGDLDLFVLNHPSNWALMNPVESTPNNRYFNSDRFYRNEGGQFIDASEEVGLMPDGYGFGLGLAVGYLDNDIHPDIYVGNDFSGRDYIYTNTGTGKFIESAGGSVKHMPLSSMGVDISDVNNDGLSDIMVLDMNAEDNFRQKTQMASMDIQGFWINVRLENHFQYMYNMLQLNVGNGSFSEIGQMAGISNTDWSWAALLADLDLDGLKDIYVTNGYPRDVNDKDIKFPVKIDKDGNSTSLVPAKERFKKYAVTPLPNYSFKNKNLTFEKTAASWGLDDSGFSMGAAYVDLDNDGDLELVVNNYNDTAFIYQNLAVENGLGSGFNVRLEGSDPNPFAIGTRVTCHSGDLTQTVDNFPVRGYESCVPHTLFFSIPVDRTVDSLVIRWPDGRISSIEDPKTDEEVIASWSNEISRKWKPEPPNKLFHSTTKERLSPHFLHQENLYDDFADEVLLPHAMSRFGPALAVGDLNGDNLEDVFLGGSSGQTSATYLHMPGGAMTGKLEDAITKDAGHEDVAAAIFDIDNDGDNDLYVGSGGNEHKQGSLFYQDRLYRNNNGTFERDPTAIPDLRLATRTLAPNDFDNDGDIDLFVGAGHLPRQYGMDARSVLLRNDGGRLVDITDQVAPQLAAIGMINQAIWANVDGKGGDELVVAGDWMPVTILSFNGKEFIDITERSGLENDLGWWSAIAAHDIDNDGDLDLLAGNLGLNYKYKASHSEPFKLFAGDYDNSGTWDIALGYYNQGQCYPVRGRQCSSEQIPSIKKKFPTYKEFGVATIYDVYGEDKLDNGVAKQATEFGSMYYENDGTGHFTGHRLPELAQVSSINGFVIHDVNNDQNPDVILAGNLYSSEIETPRNDASNGLVLLGDGSGGFKAMQTFESGLFAPGDVKNIASLSSNGQLSIIVANNNGPVELFSLKD